MTRRQSVPSRSRSVQGSSWLTTAVPQRVNNRFFAAKKKALTKSLAAALLKNGRAPLKGCYSEKTGKTYDASVLLEDDGQRTGYKLVFDNG